MSNARLTRPRGRVSASGERTKTRRLKLQFIQVAFAGHNRKEDLGDPEEAAVGLKAAFAMLAKAGVHRARLISGLAPGADYLAAAAWSAAGLGQVHAVYPYLDLPPNAVADLAHSATWLDGKTTEALGRNAHLAQTRWLIGVADLLVVVWTGEHARGAGGTADAVRLALEHNIPVLWIKPGEAALRLIRPEHLDEDFGFLEFLEELRFSRAPLVRKATPAAIYSALADLGLAGELPSLEPEAEAPKPILFIPWWRAYSMFRRSLGGTAAPFKARPPPADLVAEPGFQRLTQAYARVDMAANSLGAMHRSHQIILLGVAIVATFVGSAPSLWPNTKLIMVTIELTLAVGAFAVWLASERGRRHQRWGDLRQRAEDLRLERVAWALGVNPIRHGMNFASGRAARHVRRLAGVPTGAFDRRRVKAWGDWALDELIVGQAAYHRAQSLINGRVSHRVHEWENISFAAFMIVLLSYVVAAISMLAFQGSPPSWLDGLVGLAGAMAPAIGATGLALEATLALNEQGQRSRVLAVHLEAIVSRMSPKTNLEALQAAAKAAIRLQRAQETHWTEGTARRRLIRGG